MNELKQILTNIQQKRGITRQEATSYIAGIIGREPATVKFWLSRGCPSHMLELIKLKMEG